MPCVPSCPLSCSSWPAPDATSWARPWAWGPPRAWASASQATATSSTPAPEKAYANNKKGLLQFLDKDYPAARQTFEATLESYPGNPDAVYYLGLTKIFLGEREAGYKLLRSYRDPNNFRISQEVVWWANYCAKKPELTPEKIREVLNKARGEGYRQQIEDERFRLGWY